MTTATLQLRELNLGPHTPNGLRNGLVGLQALLLLGRRSEHRETSLRRLGISPEQAEQVAYKTPVVLSPEARRATITASGTAMAAALQKAQRALKRDNPTQPDLFDGLSQLYALPPGELASLVHTLDADARTADPENCAGRLYALVRQLDGDSKFRESHLTPIVSSLTRLLLDCGPQHTVLVASESLSPTVEQLLSTGTKERALTFQARSQQAQREVALLALLQDTATVATASGEPLMNPLVTDARTLQRFDRICLEPPFGLKLGEREIEQLNADRHKRFRFGSGLHRNTRELGLAQHAMATLESGGIATLLAPAGVNFRGGREGDMRRALIEADAIEVIVALPSGTVAGTMVETALLKLVAHKRPERRGQLLFVSVPPTEKRRENPLTEQLIQQIRDCLENWSGVPGLARIVSTKEMAEHGFVLQAGRFIDDFAPPPALDWEKAHARLALLEASAATHAAEVDALLANPPR